MGLKTKWTAVAEFATELGRTASDLAHAFAPGANPVAKRLTLAQRLREIVYFRFHRNLGALTGLLENHALETRAERELTYFDRPARAVVVHGPGRASLDLVDMPEVKPGDVVIRVAHVAVCATDHEILNGTLGYFHNGLGKYPIVPGHEFSGRVASVGQNVSQFAEGDQVVVECIQGCGVCAQCRADNAIGCAERTELGVLKRNGAYADYVVVPARFVHKLPEATGLRAAALAEPLAVVLKGLRRLAPVLAGRDGLNCLVIGAGPIGHLVARVLAHRGHSVTAYDRNPKRLELFAGTAIQTTTDLGALAGHHVVVEATGNPEVLDRALHDSPANAALLLLGLPYGQRAFSFEAIAAYDKTVVGSVGSTAVDFEDALALMPALDLSAYFQCSMALEDFQKAWAAAKAGDVLKVMLDVEP
jgi:2-desacetyl-2-hydroxyethyl bacteriochlorophyllide A dehydrogenase